MASHGYKMVRYADDFVVLCQSREEAEAPWRSFAPGWQRTASACIRTRPISGTAGKRAGASASLATASRANGGTSARRAWTSSKTRSGPRRSGPGREPRTSHRQSEPGFARLVQLLQARPSPCLQTVGWVGAKTVARLPAQAGKASRLRPLSGRSNALDQRLLRGRWAVRTSHGLAGSEMLPMRKLPTGEPCAGKPHARFGGRGGKTVPTPIAATYLPVSGTLQLPDLGSRAPAFRDDPG